MMDVEKKNIIFLSDEDTPYAKEFTLLNDEEIADLVERRLFSNNYFNYTIYSIHKSKGIITLIRDACGHKLETTLSKIEDGLIPEKCTACRQAEKDKLLAFKDEIQDELSARGLVVVLFETEENKDSLYIECTKCGAKYYLNDDFNLDDEAWEMYCKNWDCMMEVISEKHWLANAKIVFDGNYDSEYIPFIMDYEDWIFELGQFDGYYEVKCEDCNAIIILPLGKWECTACLFTSEETYSIKRWDEIHNEVVIACKKCGNEYKILCEKSSTGEMFLDTEILNCFECYKRDSNHTYVCPVCDTKYHDKCYCCTTCGFVMDEICNEKIDTQTQYTMWLKNTVIPCSKIWNKIAPQYIKTLKDLNASLENETKLLTEKKALTSQLSKCHSAISSFTQKVSDLEDEIKYKNAKISEMQAKTSVLSMLNQSQTAVAKPNFRNLINKFAIVLNDDITIEFLKKEMPEQQQFADRLVACELFGKVTEAIRRCVK